MDCPRAQHLVSPYLDQQLTGVEMLEMQQHLAECRHCAEEYLSARQIKLLLRSLSLPDTESSLERRILTRLAQEERRSESFLPALPPRSALPAIWLAPPSLQIPLPAPSRGQRLAAALALSCLAVLTVAAPFAPSTPNDTAGADRAVLGQAAMIEPIPSAGLSAVAAYGSPWMRPASVDSADQPSNMAPPSDRDVTFVRRDAQPPLADAGAEPLGDVAASGYVSGDVAFVGYRVH